MPRSSSTRSCPAFHLFLCTGPHTRTALIHARSRIRTPALALACSSSRIAHEQQQQRLGPRAAPAAADGDAHCAHHDTLLLQDTFGASAPHRVYPVL